ncbi:MAG: hypothetical protein FJZ57_05150 [Chlamydiae bacterium]|nr:hypothetical protein [Chlamydiota bacterium]
MNPAILTTIKKLIYFLYLGTIFSCLSIHGIDIDSSKDESVALCPNFTPPENWELVDPKLLSPSVIVGYVDKSKIGFLPSMNLAVEKVNVSLSKYVQEVKKLYQQNKINRWRDLGIITTKAGKARLTEVDTKNKWGDVRILQLIFLKNQTAYILTTSAKKEDFHNFYLSIQKSLLSFDLGDDVYSFVEDEKLPTLKQEVTHLKHDLLSLEEKDPDFPNPWITFDNFIKNNHANLGSFWYTQIINLLKNETSEERKGKDA